MKKKWIKRLFVVFGICAGTALALLLFGIWCFWPTHHAVSINLPVYPVTESLSDSVAVEALTDYWLGTLQYGLVQELQDDPAGFNDNLRTSLINMSMWGPFKDGSEWGLCMLGDQAWMRKGLFFAMPFVRWMCEPFLFPVDVKQDGGNDVYNLQSVMALIEQRWTNGMGVSLDNVGDASLSPTDAKAYCDYYLALFRQYGESSVEPDMCVSLKLSALVYDLEQLCGDDDAGRAKYDEIKQSLHGLLAGAKAVTGRTVFIRLDMEEYVYKDKTLQVFRDLVETYPELTRQPDGSLRLGVVIQAYLRDSKDDMHQLADWGRDRGVIVPVRLVKGAYLQHEREVAEQNGVPSPVWDVKAQTDACFEELTGYMMTNRDVFKPAVASHNLRSLAHAMAVADRFGITRDQYELQMLYGMGNPIKQVLLKQGCFLREYVPAGPLARGLKYAGRRFDELAAKDNALSRTLHGDFTVY